MPKAHLISAIDNDDEEMQLINPENTDALQIPDFLPNHTHADMETWSCRLEHADALFNRRVVNRRSIAYLFSHRIHLIRLPDGCPPRPSWTRPQPQSLGICGVVAIHPPPRRRICRRREQLHDRQERVGRRLVSPPIRDLTRATA